MADALGYHEDDANGVPVGYVFAATTMQAGDHWEATFSHEALEQLADPGCNGGRMCLFNRKPAFVDFEVCDAVENDEYLINGINVSNFVLPSWWQSAGLPGQKFDLLGNLLAPLSLSPGGYFGYTTNGKTWNDVFGRTTPDHQRQIARLSRRWRRRIRMKPKK